MNILNSEMKRTFSVRLFPTKEQKEILKELQIRCARLWNKANYILRQHFFKTGEILSYETVFHLVKDSQEYKALPSDIAQVLLKKLSESWSSFKELKKLQEKGKLPEHIKKVSPPKYYKDRKENKTIPMNMIPILNPRSYSLGDFFFSFTLPKDLKKKYSIKKRLTILATYTIPYENFKLTRAEIVRRNGKWYVHVSIDVEQSKKSIRGKNYASIDLGARNLIVLAIYDREKKLIRVYQFKSKELWKEYKYWDKKIAKYQSKLSKSGHKGKSVKLRKLYEKRKKRIMNAMRGMGNKIVELLQKYEVKEVFVGDLTGIRNAKDYGRKVNKLLHNFWIRRQIEQILKDKLEEAGIGFVPIPEGYTSKVCFNCEKKVKRDYNHYVICSKCGRLHGDTNGAVNILRRKLGNVEWKRIREVHLVWKFKRTNRWVFRYLRIYKKDKDKLLVRGWANNPPVRVRLSPYSPKSSLAPSVRGG